MTKRKRKDENAFSRRLANDPRFIAIIELSRRSFETTGGVSLAELRKQHGLSPKRRRRAIRGQSKAVR